jgi:hypothetical protein
MAYRFVRARPLRQRLSELRDRLEDGEIKQMEPFGQALAKALQGARVDPETGEAIWNYSSPPLAMERVEALDEYFAEITVVDKNVRESDGWERIEDYPGLWNRALDTASNRSRPWVDIRRH